VAERLEGGESAGRCAALREEVHALLGRAGVAEWSEHWQRWGQQASAISRAAVQRAWCMVLRSGCERLIS
jgi:hypothetical protein